LKLQALFRQSVDQLAICSLTSIASYLIPNFFSSLLKLNFSPNSKTQTGLTTVKLQPFDRLATKLCVKIKIISLRLKEARSACKLNIYNNEREIFLIGELSEVFRKLFSK
jgi:hypothetical protein